MIVSTDKISFAIYRFNVKILFLSDNFPPEYNAPATRTFEHCREWVRLGVDVTVVTCFPNFPQGKIFPGYKNKLYQKEEIDGIHVIRVWSFISSNRGFFKRTLDFMSYALMAFFVGFRCKTDMIVATSPQFFTAVSGYLLSIFKRKRWVMEVRDLWPESISAVNAVKTGAILRWLEKLELHLYKKCAMIIVVTDSFKKNMLERGIPENKIQVVKNGANLDLFKPRVADSLIKQKLSVNGNFVIGYIGTHGLAHSLTFIVKSLSQVEDKKIKFLFIGDGAEKQNVLSIARNVGLDNVIFSDPVEKSQVPKYLSVIDVALVPLKRSDTFKSVIPSKIFESAAMGKPILLGVDGESRNIIENYNAGLFFEPEDTDDFIHKVEEIKTASEEGVFAPGCSNLAHDFDRKILAKKMLDLISELVRN